MRVSILCANEPTAFRSAGAFVIGGLLFFFGGKRQQGLPSVALQFPGGDYAV